MGKQIKKLVKKVVKVIKKVVKAVVGVVKSVLGLGSPKFDDSDFNTAGSQGILINKTGSSVSLPVVYGATRIGGAQVYATTSGTDNVNLDIVFALCEGEIEALNGVLLDGVQIASHSGSGNRNNDFSMVAPYTSSNCQIYFRTGTDSQTSISQLAQRESGSGWDPRFRGIAYVYMRLVYDKEVWKNGLPTVTFDVKGKKVPTISASPSYSFSDDPARCILDYLTNTRYGKGIELSDIDLASFTTASQHFSSEGYKCRGNVDTSVNIWDNLIDLFSSCASYLTFGNKYRIVSEKADSTVAMHFDDSNTIGNVTYQMGSKSQLLNRVKIKFMDEATEYRDNIKIIESSTLKANDNGQILEQEIFFPFNKTATQAIDLGRLIINQSRQSHTINMKATIAAVNLQVGDIVTVTNETFGITAKKFRVRETVLLPTNEIELSLQEYDPDVFGNSIITDYKDDNN